MLQSIEPRNSERENSRVGVRDMITSGKAAESQWRADMTAQLERQRFGCLTLVRAVCHTGAALGEWHARSQILLTSLSDSRRGKKGKKKKDKILNAENSNPERSGILDGAVEFGLCCTHHPNDLVTLNREACTDGKR